MLAWNNNGLKNDDDDDDDGIKNDYITESNKEVIDFMVASNLLNDGYKYINVRFQNTLHQNSSQ